MFRFIILSLISCVCFAQPIEFVVTTSIGGPNDVVTRRLVDELEKNTDLKFVVVNKPGAAHNIGYTYIHQSNKPTLFISTDTIITNKDKEGYPDGIMLDVETIFHLGDFTNIIFVNSNSIIKNVDDLIQLSIISDVKFGHGGIGTYSHLSASKICENRMNCLMVPYKSGNPAMLDLLGDSIDAYSLISYGSESFLQNIKFRPIVMFSKTKHDYIKVPILTSKLHGLETKNWVRIFGKNISNEDKKKIVNILNSKNENFYRELGLWYDKK